MSNYVEVVDIPPKRTIDCSTPLGCIRSMGLLDTNNTPTADQGALVSLFEHKGSEVAAAMWTHIGGAKIAHHKDVILIHGPEDVEGMEDASELEHAPITFCVAKDVVSGQMVSAIFSVNRLSHVADVCVFDPTNRTAEEKLYYIMGAMGFWTRHILGPGWGLRMEVYHQRYSPSEIPQFKLPWLFLMCLIKVYMPHTRMVDTQSVIRMECMVNKLFMADLVGTILQNIARIVKSDI